MMKVIRWIDYDDAESYKEAIGGLGGFFENGMRWADYIDQYDDIGKSYAEALRVAIVNKKLKCTGSQHQNGDNNVPVYEDETVSCFSFRSWGDLLAAVWSEEENRDYCYMDFYC